MTLTQTAFYLCFGFYIWSCLCLLVKWDHWWIRIFDFPRLQLFGFALITFTLFMIFSKWDRTFFLTASLILTCLAIDAYHIFPYAPFWPAEALAHKDGDPEDHLSLLTFNVLQSNREFQKTLDYVNKKEPDIFLALEVDQEWAQQLSSLKEKYQYVVEQPQDNTYGMALYSRLPLKNVQVNDLIEKNIPSIEARVITRSQREFRLFALHPEPPRPEDGPTTERDAELVLVAKKISKDKMPTMVFGDMNDVAWSHTTRLFRRLSGLLDPRIGRGMFSTFHVNWGIMRFPLDHYFYSREFRLKKIGLGDDLGSDHFPIFIELSFEPEHLREQKPQQEKTKADEKEATETLDKVKTTP